MKKKLALFSYALLASFVMILDRLTKWHALENWQLPEQVTKFLSFELAFNRGISWGLFHSASNCLFGVVSLIIASVTIFVGVIAWQRYKERLCIAGEILVIAGSVSNLIDRAVYGAVVDFIVLSYGEWVWPVFNVADMAIVLGVTMMAWEQYRS